MQDVFAFFFFRGSKANFFYSTPMFFTQNTNVTMKGGDDRIDVRRIFGPTQLYLDDGDDTTRVLRNLVERTNFIQRHLEIFGGAGLGIYNFSFLFFYFSSCFSFFFFCF